MPQGYQFIVDLIKWLQSKIACFSLVNCDALCTDIKILQHKLAPNVGHHTESSLWQVIEIFIVPMIKVWNVPTGDAIWLFDLDSLEVRLDFGE